MKTIALVLFAIAGLSGCMVVPVADPVFIDGRHYRHHDGGHHHGPYYRPHRGRR